MESPPQDGTPLGRRAILRTAALLPVTAALTAGCTAFSQPEEPDPLEAVAERARSDAALARAIQQAHPDLAEETAAVEAVRSDHARALRQEIDRVNPQTAETTTSIPPTPAPPAPQEADEAAAALKQALREAQRQAADLVPGMPPHRAGLTGSLAASCASLLEVLA
ncbi:hypothetical protein DFQ14_11425 [Halopolyspora algeriensis]|uniref:Uncharacterized protein n=1 Tax=Halopolyspora algeriensis TaxID=1500506 RepID=A0A368VJC5_9ACTN|nr:hypothetical protein [Halopolyspora algeriensis]RCW39764.1 hypothetical protein DFQ14_11425 [Halopolyspora algeriensis]TQM56419.1 hypothetical protein FHU43_1217 [Halopolyspora algeriensis]